MKVVLVHNPGAGKSGLSADDLQHALRRHGYEPVCASPEQDPAELARAQQAAFVVVAGGDGTLRSAALSLANSGVAMAPVPLGTANNVSRSLGVTGPLEETIAGWDPRKARTIDLGEARGPWGTRRFLEGCGFGLIGRSIAILEAIDRVAEHEYSNAKDKLHRDLSVFVALAQEIPPVRLALEIDEKTVQGDYLLLEIFNIRHVGPRIELAPGADPGDGFFDVVAATSRDRPRLKERLDACLAGSPAGPILDSVQAKIVRLTMEPGEFRIDDQVVLEKDDFDGRETTPVEISLSVLPAALRIILPDTVAAA